MRATINATAKDGRTWSEGNDYSGIMVHLINAENIIAGHVFMREDTITIEIYGTEVVRLPIEFHKRTRP